MARLVASVALLGASSTVAGTASAFCRATTTNCDPLTQTCAVDAHGCLTTGAPLSWPAGAVQLFVNDAGSAALGITGADALAALETAQNAWKYAVCPGGAHPTLHLAIPVLGKGLTLWFDPHGGNSSDLLFFDDHWPFAKTVLAKTVLGFKLSGEMLDADLAFNSQDYVFVTDPPASSQEVDLVAVLTHEIGHVLGLGHSDVPTATMRPETLGFATPDLRSLDPDDVAGICAIYPPDKTLVVPPDGIQTEIPTGPSGCAVSSGARGSSLPIAALAAVLAVVRRRARRSRG
jgi:hypothetical protein